MTTENKTTTDPEEKLRHHTYDGIQEYDKRLPNWWLWTLYGAIIFAFAYWLYYQWPLASEPSGRRIEKQMAQIEASAVKSEGGLKELTDDNLWDMSKDEKVVSAGRTIFLTTCASCHKPDLTGLVGPNLKVQQWIHGGKPTEIVNTITTGVPPKGMPTWGPVLGKEKISQVASYVLSFHTKGEPIVIVASKPVALPAATAAPSAAK
jgi:cytochrome c oxidase cbb3-type subunit 3